MELDSGRTPSRVGRRLALPALLSLLLVPAFPAPGAGQAVEAFLELDWVRKPTWDELRTRPEDFSGDTIVMPGTCKLDGPPDLPDSVPWLYQTETADAATGADRAARASVVLLTDPDSRGIDCRDLQGRAVGLFRSQFRYLGSLELIFRFPLPIAGGGAGGSAP